MKADVARLYRDALASRYRTVDAYAVVEVPGAELLALLDAVTAVRAMAEAGRELGTAIEPEAVLDLLGL